MSVPSAHYLRFWVYVLVAHLLGFPRLSKMAFRIRKNPEILQKEIESGKNLVEATENNDTDKVKNLLECGVSVNADEYNRTLFYKCQNYMTPLQIAATKGFHGPLALLIDFGGKVFILRISFMWTWGYLYAWLYRL